MSGTIPFSARLARLWTTEFGPRGRGQRPVVQPLRTPGLDHGLVAPARVDPLGLTGPTRGAAAGPRWRRTSTGLYVAADVAPSSLQRTLEVGVCLPRYAAVTGWAALAWLGGRWSSGLRGDGTPLPVPVALGRHSVRPREGLLLCEERYDPRETEVVDGIRVTSAVRSVCFEVRYAAHLPAAVLALDMAAHDDLVSIAEADAWVRGHPSWTGIGQGRDAVPLASENSWSPMEVQTRTTWILDAGLPEPAANRPVFDLAGRHLLTPDLIDAEAGVVAEYDGGTHAELGPRRVDRGRQELYRERGLECVVVMAGDLREPHEVVRRLHAAYARAAARSGPRSWTVEQPTWWRDTSTVEARRALSDEERSVWLGYRRSA